VLRVDHQVTLTTLACFSSNRTTSSPRTISETHLHTTQKWLGRLLHPPIIAMLRVKTSSME
jgi:hypothetical protein